ncbi:MAG: substrate-binding domain-containing protein [Jiangellaceae bacterium]
MAHDQASRRRVARVLVALVVTAAVAVGGVTALALRDDGGDTAAPNPPSSCGATLLVVTASSFAPVLKDLAQSLETSDDCVQLQIDVADGRGAIARVTEIGADVWLPDDAAWAGAAESLALAEAGLAGSGTAVATSPIYMVTDEATAELLVEAGGTWRALAELATNEGGVRLAAREPAGSGDGLIGLGGVGEAVWLDEGMEASAEALATVRPSTRTLASHAVPAEPGEVGLVAEYALIPLVTGGPAAEEYALLPGTDYSVQLRYTWLPTTEAADDPELARRMDRVLSALTGPEADDAFAAARLRRPDGGPPAGAPAGLPEISAAPLGVLGAHNVDHVFAAWYAEDRRSDLLVAVDVSGSMGSPVSASGPPLIDVVQEGILRLADLLPDDSELSLWEFGSLLAPPLDYRSLLPRGPLNADRRERLVGATEALAVRETGTGLYDTILAAYVAARDGYREAVPNHVVLFTDGRNEDDPGSVSAQQLGEQLAAAQDPERPVQLTVITFGPEPEAGVLAGALEGVGGSVSPLTTAGEVRAVFIHLAAGGIHH